MQALREMRGSASAAEAAHAVIERENVSEAELEKTLKNGQPANALSRDDPGIHSGTIVTP